MPNDLLQKIQTEITRLEAQIDAEKRRIKRELDERDDRTDAELALRALNVRLGKLRDSLEKTQSQAK